MDDLRRSLLASLGLLSIVVGSACGGSTGAGTSPPPPPACQPPHRPTPVGCETTRPPGLDGGAAFLMGTCKNDSQCTQGQNGRCESGGGTLGPQCTYDACFVDTDCAPQGKACLCGSPNEDVQGRTANTCMGGNCAVDADCGPGGLCSPSNSPGACLPQVGTTGFYCRTPHDTCDCDSDCDAGGFCAFDPALSHFACWTPTCGG